MYLPSKHPHVACLSRVTAAQSLVGRPAAVQAAAEEVVARDRAVVARTLGAAVVRAIQIPTEVAQEAAVEVAVLGEVWGRLAQANKTNVVTRRAVAPEAAVVGAEVEVVGVAVAAETFVRNPPVFQLAQCVTQAGN